MPSPSVTAWTLQCWCRDRRRHSCACVSGAYLLCWGFHKAESSLCFWLALAAGRLLPGHEHSSMLCKGRRIYWMQTSRLWRGCNRMATSPPRTSTRPSATEITQSGTCTSRRAPVLHVPMQQGLAASALSAEPCAIDIQWKCAHYGLRTSLACVCISCCFMALAPSHPPAHIEHLP